MYYATGGNDPYHMPLNSFTSFLDDAAIPDPDSLSIKRSDCDTIFIVCNFQPDKNSPDVAVNDEHAMMRFEFLEAIVRLGELRRCLVRAYGDLLYGHVLCSACMHAWRGLAVLLPPCPPSPCVTRPALVVSSLRRCFGHHVDMHSYCFVLRSQLSPSMVRARALMTSPWQWSICWSATSSHAFHRNHSKSATTLGQSACMQKRCVCVCAFGSRFVNKHGQSDYQPAVMVKCVHSDSRQTLSLPVVTVQGTVIIAGILVV